MSHLTISLRASVRRLVALARSTNSFASATSTVVIVAILGIWLTVVIVTTTKHEFWRDEIRALSLARDAVSPLDLYGLTQYEGHPILWYLLLYIGKSIADTSLVLPIMSIAIAFVAVAVFMLLSPFELWFRVLFIICALPFYEYSVMARNYGISMLLLFLSASLYRHRAKHPVALACVLALLANTNVHSAIFSCLIAAAWAWEMKIQLRAASARVRRLSLYLPLGIVVAGVTLCIVWTWPRENTIVTTINHSFHARTLARSLFWSVAQPGQTFFWLVPTKQTWVASTLLYPRRLWSVSSS